MANLIGGELIGPDGTTVTGIAPLGDAGPHDLSLLADARHVEAFRESRAGTVLVAPPFRDLPHGPPVRIVIDDPLHALVRVLPELAINEPSAPWGVHPHATIGARTRWSGRLAVGPGASLGPDVLLGADCRIGAGTAIGAGVRLGDSCRVAAGVTIEPGVEMGDRVVIGPGTRLGSFGFGYLSPGGRVERVPHIGRCLVGSDVEIGDNCTVDRGSLGDTLIGDETKIDNLVHVAHNVRIGKRCFVMAQVGIAGSTRVEDDVILAGQAGLADHLTVGRGARVAAQGGVIGDIPPRATVSGYPARHHRHVLRQAAALKRLTPLVDDIERIVERDAPRG